MRPHSTDLADAAPDRGRGESARADRSGSRAGTRDGETAELSLRQLGRVVGGLARPWVRGPGGGTGDSPPVAGAEPLQ